MRERGCACPPHAARARAALALQVVLPVAGVARGARPEAARAARRAFVRWVNATPNLQASTFRHPGAVQQAVKAGRSAGRKIRPKPGSASDSREWRPRLGAALAHFDLVSPTEEFDAAFLLAAETLGLQHVSFHRVEPTCQKGYLERYDLEDSSQCAQLEQNVAHCEWWRRPACAPEWQAECDAAVRRVAPLDAWLHRTATRRFRATMEAVDGGFAARLAAFQAKRFGVWKGGPPTRPSASSCGSRPSSGLRTGRSTLSATCARRGRRLRSRPSGATRRCSAAPPSCRTMPRAAPTRRRRSAACRSRAGATRHHLDIYVLRTRLEDHLLRLGRGQRRRTRRGGGRRRR